jgi:LmbE family N-acetylglucosaminyl deacetylase
MISSTAMHPYHRFVAESARLLHEARRLPHGGFDPSPRPSPLPEAGTAVVFAPHPDDECLTGALALRLLRRQRMRVVVAALTLGSNPARQAERSRELEGACAFLGFEPAPAGEPPADVLARERPSVIFCPHAGDAHPTHARTHAQVMAALAAQPADFACRVVLTEYWAPLAQPNLVVESTVDEVADLVAATSFHAGEVSRHAYHVELPAWMQDNARRGSELIGGLGSAASRFDFATLYRVEGWSTGRVLSSSDDPAIILP